MHLVRTQCHVQMTSAKLVDKSLGFAFKVARNGQEILSTTNNEC